MSQDGWWNHVEGLLVNMWPVLRKALQPRKGRLGKARARRSDSYVQGT